MDKSNNQNMGSGGFCFCVKCGFTASHKSGAPCQEERCPICGRKLLRKGSQHHQKYLEKNKPLPND